MPIADWTVDFSIRDRIWAPGSEELLLNQSIAFSAGAGAYMLRQDGCKLGPTVRAQINDVPQGDGSILHCRYVTGMQMDLAIQMWEADLEKPACDDLLQEMLDELMAYLYNLINAGDNDGRVFWKPAGVDQRMIDDCRLLVYPVETHPDSGIMEIAVTIDTQWPYAVDAAQLEPVIPGNVVNAGNRPTYPVWIITYPVTYTTVANSDTGEQFSWDSSRPGTGGALNPGEYLEIDTFRNTIYKNGVGANLKAGIVMDSSEFFSIPPGTSPITLSEGGVTSHGLINAAWA